jgi:hypothetical protein
MLMKGITWTVKQDESAQWTRSCWGQGTHTAHGASIKIAAIIQSKPWVYSNFHRAVALGMRSTPTIMILNKTESTVSLNVRLHLNSLVLVRGQACRAGDHLDIPWATDSINTMETCSWQGKTYPCHSWESRDQGLGYEKRSSRKHPP